jgi:DNA gyrase inhibitor GyrI
VKFESLRSAHFLSIRHVGAYAAIPAAFTEDDRLWNALVEWARDHNIPCRPIPFAIYYDNPTLTPKPLQQCDACIPIDMPVAGTRAMRCMEFTGGRYGVAEHIGPYSTMIQGFQHVADGIRSSDTYVFRTEPALAIARGIHVDKESSLNHTDVYTTCLCRKSDER